MASSGRAGDRACAIASANMAGLRKRIANSNSGPSPASGREGTADRFDAKIAQPLRSPRSRSAGESASNQRRYTDAAADSQARGGSARKTFSQGERFSG